MSIVKFLAWVLQFPGTANVNKIFCQGKPQVGISCEITTPLLQLKFENLNCIFSMLWHDSLNVKLISGIIHVYTENPDRVLKTIKKRYFMSPVVRGNLVNIEVLCWAYCADWEELCSSVDHFSTLFSVFICGITHLFLAFAWDIRKRKIHTSLVHHTCMSDELNLYSIFNNLSMKRNF